MATYALSEATAAKLKEVLGSYRSGSPPHLAPATSSGAHIAIIPCLEKAGDTPDDNWPYYDAGIPKWLDSRPKSKAIGSGKHFLMGLDGQPLATSRDYLAIAGPEVNLYHAGQMRTRTLWIAIVSGAAANPDEFVREVEEGETLELEGVEFVEAKLQVWNKTTKQLEDGDSCWFRKVT